MVQTMVLLPAGAAVMLAAYHQLATSLHGNHDSVVALSCLMPTLKAALKTVRD